MERVESAINTAVARGIGRGHTNVAMSVDEAHALSSFITRNNKGGGTPMDMPYIEGNGKMEGSKWATSLCIYSATEWDGLAPCTDGDFLTLALCKVALRNASTPPRFVLVVPSVSLTKRRQKLTDDDDFFLWENEFRWPSPLYQNHGCNQGVRRKDQIYKCSLVYTA